MRNALLTLLIGWLLVDAGCVQVIRQTERGIERTTQACKQRKQSLDVEPVDWTIREGHPRIDALPDDWAESRKLAESDPVARRWLDILNKRAADLREQPLIDYSSKKLLTRSREALKRIPLYAGLYRITGDRAMAEAGRKELLNVCAFDDWQPTDFLATSEMMHAAAVGYDWLYEYLSKADRKKVVAAIVEKGLEPAFDGYASGGGWTTASHNWNLVCNGGLIVAALAVSEEEPDTARSILALAMKSIPNGLASYDACAGGWVEGPMYHNYATRYAVFAAAALQTAPRRAIELPSKFFSDAGDYRIQLTGPTGKSFNFGDSSETIGNSSWLLWMARQYDRPEYARFQMETEASDPSIFDLVWYRPPAKADPLPLAQAFPECEVAAMRSSWRDDATFLAIKGGRNEANHTHLDLGTFVLDMRGQRWASELGPDNYDMPGYLGPRRSEYLRSATPGQNTLVINDVSQPAAAKADVKLNAKGRTATVDLSDAYPGAKRVIRTATVDADGTATLSDEIALDDAAPIVWHMHTSAAVEIVRGDLVLKQNGQTIHVRLDLPKSAQVKLEDDRTRPPALPIEGMTDVRIIIPEAKSATIRATFSPSR